LLSPEPALASGQKPPPEGCATPPSAESSTMQTVASTLYVTPWRVTSHTEVVAGTSSGKPRACSALTSVVGEADEYGSPWAASIRSRSRLFCV
jgi:hypothetical protein